MLTAALNLATAPFFLLLIAFMAGACVVVWRVERRQG